MEKINITDEERSAIDVNGEAADEMYASAEIIEILYLTFLLGNDIFGIEVGEIREVIEYKKVFKVPGAPDYIKGVINLRGEVVPVIDLHSRFYNKSTGIAGSTSIVVVEVNDENRKVPVGVMIDSVKAVTGVGKNSIEAVPEIGSRIRSEFIHGIGKENEQFVILLNIQKILDLEELSDNFSMVN